MWWKYLNYKAKQTGKISFQTFVSSVDGVNFSPFCPSPRDGSSKIRRPLLLLHPRCPKYRLCGGNPLRLSETRLGNYPPSFFSTNDSWVFFKNNNNNEWVSLNFFFFLRNGIRIGGREIRRWLEKRNGVSNRSRRPIRVRKGDSFSVSSLAG